MVGLAVRCVKLVDGLWHMFGADEAKTACGKPTNANAGQQTREPTCPTCESKRKK